MSPFNPEQRATELTAKAKQELGVLTELEDRCPDQRMKDLVKRARFPFEDVLNILQMKSLHPRATTINNAERMLQIGLSTSQELKKAYGDFGSDATIAP